MDDSENTANSEAMIKPSFRAVVNIGVVIIFLCVVHSQLSNFRDKRLAKLLLLTINHLEACGVSHFVTYSTLLGLIREGSLLRDETDGDIMLTSMEARQAFIRCGAGALKVDWKRNDYGGIKVFDEYGMYVDIESLEEQEDGILVTVTGAHCQNGEHATFCRTPEIELLPTKILETRELGNVHVPRNTTAYLERLYGHDWRTPRPGWKGNDTTPLDTFKAAIWPIINTWLLLSLGIKLLWIMRSWCLLLLLVVMIGCRWGHLRKYRYGKPKKYEIHYNMQLADT